MLSFFDTGKIDNDCKESELLNSDDIDILASILENGRKTKKLKEQEEIKKKISDQWEEKKNKIIDRDFVMNNMLAPLNNVPLVKDTDSAIRLEKFAIECLSEEAPLSQGYYFNSEENVYQFIREVLLKYYLGNYKRLKHTWKIKDSVKMVDHWIDNIITIPLVIKFDLFFIVNSYNRYFKSKRHKMLYRLVDWVRSYREKEGKRTFILSLTHDVGTDKGFDNGFSIPMLPLNTAKMKEYLEAIANKKNLWC